MPSGPTTWASWPSSKGSSKPRRLALLQVLAALEHLLDLAVDLLEAERDLRGYGVHAAVHADRLHALQELDVQEGLRRRAVGEERLVQGERIERPLDDPLEVLLGQHVGLAEDVDERESMPELDRRAEEDRGNESGGGPDQRGIVQVHERRVLPAEGVDQDRSRGAEGEQFNLPRR